MKKCSYTGVEVLADDLKGPAQRTSLIISGLNQAIGEALFPPVKLISGPVPEIGSASLPRSLFEALESRNFRSSFISWDSKQISEEAVYIVLDLGDTPVLVDPSSTLFASITALVTQASRILWISGQQNKAESFNPEKGLVTGFARVARTENAALKFITLDIQQDFTLETSRLVQAITNILCSSLCDDPEGHHVGDNPDDIEYVYRNGQLFVPRLLPDHQFNSSIAGSEKLGVETGLFHQPQRPLKLHVEKPGLLDSLVFVDDKGAQVPLQPEELEIQVAAFGINFKDVFVALG